MEKQSKTEEWEEKCLERKRLAILLEGIRQKLCEYGTERILKAKDEEDAKEKGKGLFIDNKELENLIAVWSGKTASGIVELGCIDDQIRFMETVYREKFLKELSTAEDEHDLEFIFDDYKSFILDCEAVRNGIEIYEKED